MDVDTKPTAGPARGGQQPEDEASDDPIDALAIVNPEAAIQALQPIADAQPLAGEEEKIRMKEHAVLKLGRLLAKQGRAADLHKLMLATRPFLDLLSKARGGQLFKSLLDLFLEMPSSHEEKIQTCTECIEWTQTEKRTFLRQSLEIRLIQLLLQARSYQPALQQINPMLRELKRLDDKSLLVDVHLMESKAYYALSNYPRARAALVAARTTANGIYCPPRMQAGLDLQSGILHAQEKDFKTAYSYFYEAFEGYDGANLPVQAVGGLKYMLLSKIMLNEASDVSAVVSGKLALRYNGRDIDAMRAVANAYLHRSLAELHTALKDFAQELTADVAIVAHLDELQDSLLQQNLARIVEPFSCVEISHVAQLISLPQPLVERKLSQMILDQQLTGILDQGRGCLSLFEPPAADKTYEAALSTLQQSGSVVDALYKRAQKISG